MAGVEMIKVIIVDDQTFVAKSIKRVLSNERGIEVVATAHDQAQAVECAEICPHDVILMDIMLGAGSGLVAAREICGRVSTTKTRPRIAPDWSAFAAHADRGVMRSFVLITSETS